MYLELTRKIGSFLYLNGTKTELKFFSEAILQLFGHFVPVLREQMGVCVQCGFNLLMAHTFCDCQR